MVAFTSIALAATTLLGLTTAAPQGVKPTGVIHRITAGFTGGDNANGLNFEPQNVVAEIGDLVEVHFLPKNHSFAQSSFDKPCAPLAGGFFSGFQPTMQGEAPNVFTITVKDKNPIWYYCAQSNHCQMGMSGVINQNFNSPNTLTAYKANAKNTTTVIPPVAGAGGVISPNKPL